MSVPQSKPKARYKFRFARPVISPGEKAAVMSVFDGHVLTNGPKVREFEELFAQTVGGGRAVAVSSCAAALYLVLLAKGIGFGDEVIVPALTHLAVANAVELVGGKCVFVDADPTDGQLDPEAMRRALTKNTKLVTLVHMLGKPGYMGSIDAILRPRRIPLLEDCALALGCTHSGRHVGLHGIAGCFSFYPAKHITTGEGGMVLTNDMALAEKVIELRSFGHQEGMRNGDIAMPGLNFRMTEFAAALGVEQLNLFPRRLNRRVRNASVLRDRLKGYHVMGDHYALSVMVPDGVNRDWVRLQMKEKHLIETSVYYHQPTCDWAYYRNKYGPQNVPVARKICSQSIALSVGPHLSSADMELQAGAFRRCVEKRT